MDILGDLKSMADDVYHLGGEYWQVCIALVVLLLGFIVWKLYF